MSVAPGGGGVPDQGANVVRLVALQWVAVLGSLGVAVGAAGVAWGAWLPFGVVFAVTLAWAWSRPAEPSRPARRALALAVGVRSGVVLGAVYLALALTPAGGLNLPLGVALVVSLAVGAVGTGIWAAMTLIALDAAWTAPAASRAAETPRHAVPDDATRDVGGATLPPRR